MTDCVDCKITNPLCRVCGNKNLALKTLIECDKHKTIKFCGDYSEECSECRSEGYTFITGIGTTNFSFMNQNYDPYSLKYRPLKLNFADGKLKEECYSPVSYDKF